MKKKYIVIGYTEKPVIIENNSISFDAVIGTYIGGPYTDINHAEMTAAEEV